MIFRIFAGDDLVYDPYLVNNGHNVLSPKLEMELNKSGSLTFTLPPDNECYNSIQKLTTIVRVYMNNTLLFKGRVMYDERDFYNRKQIYCEGALSFLVDSQMRPYDVTFGVEDFLGLVLANHNNYVDQDKWLEPGEVTVLGSGDMNFVNQDYQSSWDCITKELIEKYSGYLRVREELEGTDLVTYVDYLAAYEDASTQSIEFGKNLLDLKEHISAEEVFTVLIPLGEKQKDSEGEIAGRLTIEEVNNGRDYLENTTGISLFGRIEKTQVWDDITTAQGLLENAQAVLESGANTTTTITIKAIDLSMVDVNVDAFRLGELVRVISSPHDIDTPFQITKIEYNITSPDQTTYTFSSDFGGQPTGTVEVSQDQTDSVTPVNRLRNNEIRRDTPTRDNPVDIGYYALTKDSSQTITDRVVKQKRKVDVTNTNIDQSYNASLAGAHDIASNLINSGFGGYVYITPDELYIMNTDSIETATKVWRWNMGGLGYWTGAAGGALGGTYGIAITQDGGIKGDYVIANTITAASIKDPSGTDWLQTINTMLESATESSGSSVSLGDIDVYAYSHSLTFSFSTGNWVRIYPGPTTVEVTPTRSETALMAFHYTRNGGTYTKYVTENISTGALTIVTITES